MSISTMAAGPDDERDFRLFESYRTYLIRVAQGKIGAKFIGPKSASDFVQESILAAVDAEQRGTGPQASDDDRKRWLGGILRNKINAARRRELILTRQPGADDGAPGSSPEPWVDAVKRERERRMLAALERLSAEDRQIVGWDLEGASRREIGERLGVSSSYASQLCKRAMKGLRNAYAEGGDSSGG